MKTTTSTTLTKDQSTATTTLVLGGNGKTGRRIVAQLEAGGLPVQIGSRSGTPAFDWDDSSNWNELLKGVGAVYIAYHPDLAVPGAAKAITELVTIAEQSGVRKLVLLSGRGEEEAERCERIVQDSSIPSTVLRCSWFNQNFSENFMRDMVLAGSLTLPASDVVEPFVDVEDIADVAVAALTDDRHNGELYELTGPKALSFTEVASALSEAIGREITYQPIPHEAFIGGMAAQGLPQPLVDLLDYLFKTILDGRNSQVADGVQRALNHEPRDFASYAKKAYAEGHWNN